MCMKGTLILSYNWDIRYLELAEQVSSWSKDPSRQIGAVAVGTKGQVLAQGYTVSLVVSKIHHLDTMTEKSNINL